MQRPGTTSQDSEPLATTKQVRTNGHWMRADWVALAILLAWVAVCFAQTLGFGYVNWDDRDYILQNPLITHPSSVTLLDHLTTPGLGYPIPVTVLSYRLDHALVGFDGPWLFHLINLLVHLVNVALVFALARSLGLGTRGAAFASVVLGLHPVVSEPVSWLTGRKDLLALCFGLVTVHLALGRLARPGLMRRLARAVAFLLALFSKPVAIALVPILVLMAMAGRERDLPWPRQLLRALARNVPELLVSLVYLPLAWLGYRAFGAARVGQEVGSSLRSAWYGLGVHLALVVGLEPPCVQHLTPSFPPPFSPLFDLLPMAAVAAVVLVLWRLRGKARTLVATALAGSLFAYLPSSGIVPIKRFIADSYVYPVLPGVGIAVALLLDGWLERVPDRLRFARQGLVPALALLLGLLTIPYAGRFCSTNDLWSQAMERYPDSWRMCRNWAVAAQELGGPGKTLEATDQCIARFGAVNFEKNRAVALFELGRHEEAGQWMRRALDLDANDRNVPAELLRLAGK